MRAPIGPCRASALVAVLSVVALGGCSVRPRVDVVVVNTSGEPVDYTWQPSAASPELETVTKQGCESWSMSLDAGQVWRLSRDGTVLAASDAVTLPVGPQLVAVEVRLAPGGAVLVLPPRSIDGPLDAPVPDCTNPG